MKSASLGLKEREKCEKRFFAFFPNYLPFLTTEGFNYSKLVQ
jgi:hypothetical protein